jgi:glutathione S-transferase
MRILWGRATSSNVRKIIWLLEELKLPYERRDAGGPFGRTSEPFYRAMNPTQLVPTLQEGDFTLWESNAILRYLANGHPAVSGAVWPADLQNRANIDRWMDAQQTQLNAAQSAVFQGLIRTRPEDRDMAAINAAMARADKVWLMLDKQLEATGGYVAGPSLTLADYCWGVHVHRWFNMEVTRSEAPSLLAWYKRLLDRPVYHQHCAGPVV